MELHDVPFYNYIVCDNYYQNFLQSDQSDDTPIREMAAILYQKEDGSEAGQIDCSAPEVIGVFLWFMWIKYNFSTHFPHLFKPAGGDGEYDATEATNAQIRALTGGDITKEEIIKKADVWRALTELDAKAREAEELNKRLKKS